ncbi:MAG: hypothetical protein IT361_13730 [Gemmatimonadaceae bacterium]|nr:hypothetical protein [Gemmatimonadaceae bacterium]
MRARRTIFLAGPVLLWGALAAAQGKSPTTAKPAPAHTTTATVADTAHKTAAKATHPTDSAKKSPRHKARKPRS